jgi:hypothetical protein
MEVTSFISPKFSGKRSRSASPQKNRIWPAKVLLRWDIHIFLIGVLYRLQLLYLQQFKMDQKEENTGRAYNTYERGQK